MCKVLTFSLRCHLKRVMKSLNSQCCAHMAIVLTLRAIRAALTCSCLSKLWPSAYVSWCVKRGSKGLNSQPSGDLASLLILWNLRATQTCIGSSKLWPLTSGQVVSQKWIWKSLNSQPSGDFATSPLSQQRSTGQPEFVRALTFSFWSSDI